MLRTVTFESDSKLTIIEDGAFCYTAIESIEIPETVTTMGSRVFAGCTNLQTIKIPETVTTMGSEVFSYCTDLQQIKIGTENIPSGWNSDWKNNCDATVINSKGDTI